MRNKLCTPMAFICAILFSCGDVEEAAKNSPEPELPAPPVTNVIFSENYQIGLRWEAVPGASGYAVSYGATPEYGITLETSEPHITLDGLDETKTYYFSVRAKRGEKIGSLPPDPIVVKGRTATTGGTVISGPPAVDTPNPLEPAEFDYKLFMAEKAAWKTQGIKNYRFTASTFPGYPQPVFTVTVFADKEPAVDYVPTTTGYNENWQRDTEEALQMIQEGHLFSPLEGSAIDELYASIEAETAHLEQEGMRATIQYNKTYHYPEVFRKFVKQPSDGNFIMGGWYKFEIYQFEESEVGSQESGVGSQESGGGGGSQESGVRNEVYEYKRR